jgi:hypothetical protein
MQNRSSLKTNSFSATNEISRLLWIRVIHYYVFSNSIFYYNKLMQQGRVRFFRKDLTNVIFLPIFIREA